MLTNRVVKTFGRLVRPKLSKYRDIFHLIREQKQNSALIKQANQLIFSQNKSYTLENQLTDSLGVSQKFIKQLSNQTFISTAYSLSMRSYRLNQSISTPLKVDDITDNLQGRYKPGHTHLKYHYSINQDLPDYQDFKLTKSRAYLFNLPSQISQKQIKYELNPKQIQSVQIKYCQLGLPAYAVIQFNSPDNLTDKIMREELSVDIKGKFCPLITQIDSNKLELDHRQLVIHNISDMQTPASLLKSLSEFGRVLHLDLPLKIYKQQSIKQIKQLYKNEKQPIQINYHKKDGTVQSEYYPPYTPLEDLDFAQQKYNQYQRRLRYCENIDVYEGKAGQISIKPRGFCIITFSCQEEAQNCYFHLRSYLKIQLKNNREDFYFDKEHREALLRHIDNSYIEECKKNNPSSNFDQAHEKMSSLTFQSFYLNLIYYKVHNHFYDNLELHKEEGSEEQLPYYFYHSYRRSLQDLEHSIGVESSFGKSFDQLVEEELYGRKLKQRKERYQVNIDDYIRGAPSSHLSAADVKELRKARGEKDDQSMHRDESEGQMDFNQEEIDQQDDYQTKKNNDYDGSFEAGEFEGKRQFSTFRFQIKSQPKTLQQKIKSHMKYNQFVRDIINEYMGVFPADKLQREFGRKAPTFANPQNLCFLDGSDFLPQKQIQRVLQFSPKPSQTTYQNFLKNNQIVKSLNINLQQTVLRQLNQNFSKELHFYTNIGTVIEQFDYEGEQSQLENYVQQLNFNSQIGESYESLKDKENDKIKIVKIGKLQPLVPLNAIEKSKEILKKVDNNGKEEDKKNLMMEKYFQDIISGKPVHKQFAECFDMKEGEIVDLETMCEELGSEIGVNLKDIEKMINLRNYSPKQIAEDLKKQVMVSQIRERVEKKTALDYNRDPSEIRAKGKDGKYVVSKFRQM